MTGLPAAESTFDSTTESVDAAEQFTRGYAESLGVDEDGRYFVGLAVREVFANAVKHGNRFHPAKKVHLRLTNPAGAIAIEVIDEGHGFDLAHVEDPCAPENLKRGSGRGIHIAREIMDDFRVEFASPAGTRVRMTKRLVPTETIHARGQTAKEPGAGS